MTRSRSTDEPAESEKKERVIHTRVPESLETELRQKAQDLGISVSNLVRNVLGHAFGLVGDVVADSHAIARAARGASTTAAAGEAGARGTSTPAAGEAGARGASTTAAAGEAGARGASTTAAAGEAGSWSGPAAVPAGWGPTPVGSLDDVLGWQPMVLGKNAVCARCNAILPRGSDAASGVTETTGGRLVICLACLEQLRA